MNSEQWDIHNLKVHTREQSWAIHYAYGVLINIEAKRYDKNVHISDSPYKACAYTRSANLCRRYLLGIGLITTDDQPVMEKVLETAQKYATEPEFKVDVLKTSYSHIDNDPMYHPDESYKDYFSVPKREFFWIYLHRDAYDIHVYTKTVEPTNIYGSGRRYHNTPQGPREVTKVTVYPLALRDTLIHNLCYAKMGKFLKERLPLSARIHYNLKLDNLNNRDNDWDRIVYFSKEIKITPEEVSKRIACAQDAISFFQKASEELSSLHARLCAGTPVETDKESYEKTIRYLKENAPLYINEEEDKDLRHIVKLILEGADDTRIACEWLNPKYRKLI